MDIRRIDFWKVLANVFQAEVPGTIEEKKAIFIGT